MNAGGTDWPRLKGVSGAARDMWWAGIGPSPGLAPLTLVRGMFLWRMGAMLQINRDFPFQVALSFDEAAMDVLDWLEGQTLEWDMYVDLPANTIRYCFRTMADAVSFKRRFGDAAEGRAVAGGW